MRKALALGVLLTAGWSLLGAPVPKKNAKPKKEVGPVEVDFSPLAGVRSEDDFKIHVIVEAGDRTKVKESYTIGAGTGVTTVRDLVKASFPAGWKVEAVGDQKLVIRGYKASGIEQVAVRVEGIPKSQAPIARRFREKVK